MSKNDRIIQILSQSKELAKEYYSLTGKPLGITGEIGETEAARLLGLELSEARQSGYDAKCAIQGKEKFYQIKTRRILPTSKPGQRVGEIKLDKEWDSVLLVLLDENFEPTNIYEAEKEAIKKALEEPGSKARNLRGALSVHKFKSIGYCVWPEGSILAKNDRQTPRYEPSLKEKILPDSEQGKKILARLMALGVKQWEKKGISEGVISTWRRNLREGKMTVRVADRIQERTCKILDDTWTWT